MKPLPDLTNTEAMAAIGRRSALGRARGEASEALRDACTLCQSAAWEELAGCAEIAATAAERLALLAAEWINLK